MEAQAGEAGAQVEIPIPGQSQVVLDLSKRPKKKATEKQLASLALAREKARANREALKKAEQDAGGLKAIVETNGEAALTPTGDKPVESGKRANDSPPDSNTPLAKRSKPAAADADPSPAVSATPTEPAAVSKGKGKGKKKPNPLLWMPETDPKEFGIKVKEPLKPFP